MKLLTIAGGGPGNEALMLPRARAAVNAAGYVFADQRYAGLVTHGRMEVFGKILHTVERIREKLEECDVTVIVSGDPLFYSLTRTLQRRLPEARIRIIPGIGSLQYLAARCGRTTEDAVFLSAHGRELSASALLDQVRSHEGVYLLCDREHHPGYIAGLLSAGGLGSVTMCVGSRLSYEDEQIVEGTAESFQGQTFANLCVVGIFGGGGALATPEDGVPCDCKAVACPALEGSDLPSDSGTLSTDQPLGMGDHGAGGNSALLCDGDFIRDKVPMTREEVRWAILGKLQLHGGAVVWDIGAGTGSVSMECGRMLKMLGLAAAADAPNRTPQPAGNELAASAADAVGPDQTPQPSDVKPSAAAGSGAVYAVERNADAIRLIEQNKEKFGLENIHVIHGDALDCIGSLPVPDCVFIGGSGRELGQLLAHIRGLGRGIRVVTACVTLETVSDAMAAYESSLWQTTEMVQINIGRGRQLGSYHVIDGSHPVTLFCGVTA